MKKKDGMVLREVCGEKVLVGEGLGAVDFGRSSYFFGRDNRSAWRHRDACRILQRVEHAIHQCISNGRFGETEVRADMIRITLHIVEENALIISFAGIYANKLRHPPARPHSASEDGG